MIRDRNFRLTGILVLGISFALSAGFADRGDSITQPLFLFTYFILSAFLSWQCIFHLHARLRSTSWKTSYKLFTSLFLSVLTALMISQFSFNGWNSIMNRQMQVQFYSWPAMLAALAAALMILGYEIIYLLGERDIDSQVVRHLDRELAEAEMNVLRNELDPHFVYNSLMPLYYLVKNDVPKAEAFACKLIQVYQYFLQNRQKDLITLEEELKFINNYFFLLRIRYKDAIRLSVEVCDDDRSEMVLPLSLQTLVENVIKHNRGSMEEPVVVNISTRDKFLVVSNSIQLVEDVPSSKVGLKNLRARYQLLAGREISVMKEGRQFIVELPLLSHIEDYDVRYCHRG